MCAGVHRAGRLWSWLRKVQIWLGPSGTCSVPKSGKHPLLCRRRMHELPAAAGWRRSGSGALRVRPEIKKKLQSQAGGTPTLTYPALVRTAPPCPRLRRAFVSNFCEIPPPSFFLFSSSPFSSSSPSPAPPQVYKFPNFPPKWRLRELET